MQTVSPETINIETLKNVSISLNPLKGRLPKDFCKAIATLQRPYIPINKEEYKKVFAVGNDYFKYENQVVTFGQADGGYALMPLQYEYADKILLKN